ncbi:MAG: efflux RND transporter permease subunit [Syntrophobacteraceae bacterium]
MFLSELSIRRPVFATVMMLALVILGIFSYRHLNIDMYPDVEIPVLTITTVYKGAPPESVEREVTRKIEEAVNPIQGVKHISSTSQEGISSIIVEFTLETRINDAAQEARAKVSAVRADLPQEMEEPVIQKLDFSAAPVISLAVRSETLGSKELTTLVDKRIKRRIENVPGVGKVDLVGSTKREVNVWLDPTRLEALGLGVNEIVAGLRRENVDTPLGRLNREGQEVPVRISGKPEEVSGYSDMIVGWRENRPVRLREIARVQDGIEEQRSFALIDGVPAVALNVLKQSGSNTVVVADGVKHLVETLSGELPEGVKLQIVRDASHFIRESVEDVQTTLLLGGLLTVFIVFCFLNSWRSTVITGLTLPISVISSFIIMNALGFTLNVMTLMGLSLAIGLLIDDAIVVRENIVRHLQRGKDHVTASLQGTAEIGLAVMATTFTIIAVFIPVAFMKGIVGRFFYQFGLTVAFAVLVSLFVSFTLDPMLSSRWVDPDIEGGVGGRKNFIFRALARFNALFEWISTGYRKIVSWALDHRKTVLAAGMSAFVASFFLVPLIGSSFFPDYDRGEFQVNFSTAPDAGLEESRGRADAILEVLRRIPGIEITYSTVGAGDTGTVREGSIYVKLKDKGERELTQQQAEAAAREGVNRIAGIIPSIVMAGRMHGGAPLMMNVKGDDLDVLKAYSEKLKKAMAEVPGVVDVASSLDQDKSEVRLYVDRARAVDVGLSSLEIVETLGPLIGGKAASKYEDQDGDSYDVRVRLAGEFRQNYDQIGRLTLVSVKPDGSRVLVPVSDIARLQLDLSPARIQRLDLRRQVTLSANNAGIPLGDAIAAIREKVEQIGIPPGYKVSWSGEAEDMAETFRYIFEALMLAVILIYLILAAQFESFIAPLSIMVSLPLSLVGVVGMLYLTGDTLNIMSLIGLIMLMGLVTKNAILLVDYTKVLRKEGLDRKSALVEAGRTRLRPIVMTTLAMIFGMLPLALALGPGAEMRAPMARAVIGGLITSTLLTLIMVPVVYTLLEDAAEAVMVRLKGRKDEIEPEAAAAAHGNVKEAAGLGKGFTG